MGDGRYPEAVTAPAKPLQRGSRTPEEESQGRGAGTEVWPSESSSHPGCGVRGRAAQIRALLTPAILLSSFLPAPSPFPSQLPKLFSLHLTDPNSLASLYAPSQISSPLPRSPLSPLLPSFTPPPLKLALSP